VLFRSRKVPQLLPNDDSAISNCEVTSRIENNLEHLVIVPKEMKYGFDPYKYWNNTMKVSWQKFDPSSMNSFAVRMNCLLGWLTVANLVTDSTVVSLAQAKVESLGLLSEAIKFNSRIIKHRASKAKQIACVVEYLGIPLNEVVLVYIDVKTHSRIEVPVKQFKD